MWLNSQTNNETERERQLRWELEEERERERQRQEEERRAREQRTRERQERWEWDRRQADDWLDALHKQRALFAEEAALWMPDDEDDDWFGPGAEACGRAIEIWSEQAKEVEDEIARLQKQIDELRERIVIRVGYKLGQEDIRPGWIHVADTLKDAANHDPGLWLQW